MEQSLTESKAPRTKISKFHFTIIQQRAAELIAGTAAFILLYGGSRSGKTAIIICLIFIRALYYPNSRHLVARFRFNHAKTSLWYDTMPKVARLMNLRKLNWNKADWFVRFPNGSEIWLAGLDDKERLEKVLGNEYATIYFNEASQISYNALVVLMSRLAQKVEGLKNRFLVDCNPPTKRHWIYNLFIMKRDPESRLPLRRPENYVSMLMNPDDNKEHLGQDYLDILDDMPERAKKRFKLGMFLDDVEGALFKQADLDAARENFARDLVRTVIAIDPAVSKKEHSNKTGIIAAGCDDKKDAKGQLRNNFFVLEDATDIYSPKGWAQKAVNLYYKYEADGIVAEVNNGGDLVRETIHAIDPNIKVFTVWASKGKLIRAEPISAISEQGRFKLVGQFIELEEQLTTFTGKTDEQSPDNFDACIWAATHLIIANKPDDDAGAGASG